jgi:protoporphyrinogen oxidase
MGSISADVAILGAGPAGLMAAWRLAGRGLSVLVLERSGAVGGMSASFEVSGTRVDHGSHRLHPVLSPQLHQLLVGLLGDDLQTRPRRGRILLGERWLPFPVRAGPGAVRALGVATGLAVVADVARQAVPRRQTAGATFADVARARVGPTLARLVYEPYVAKLWGVAAADLDGELARRRIPTASPTNLVRKALRRRPAEFLYPRRGFGQIVDALAGAALAAGAEIRTGVEVTGLTTAPGQCRLSLRPTAGDGSGNGPADVHCASVLSTIPAAALAQLLSPGPPHTAALDHLDHGGLVLAYLSLDRPRYQAVDAHYLPDAANPIARLSEPKNYRDGPDLTDRTVLCAEIPATPTAPLWSAPAEEVAATVRVGLARAGLPDAEPAAVEVRRLAAVYPRYRPGTLDRFAKWERWVTEVHPAVVTFGRQGLFVGDNLHHVLTMGMAVADAVGDDGTVDRARWQGARRTFFDHVVED